MRLPKRLLKTPISAACEETARHIELMGQPQAYLNHQHLHQVPTAEPT